MRIITQWRYFIIAFILAVLLFIGSLLIFPEWGQSYKLLLVLTILVVGGAVQFIASWRGLRNVLATSPRSRILPYINAKHLKAGRDINLQVNTGNCYFA